MPSLLSFKERIQRRRRLYWQTLRPSFHTRTRCRFDELHREDPLSRWHCCKFWQRKLSNKWNGREFAAKFGATVPKLYHSGSRVEEIPWGDLPSSYAIRAVAGTNSKHVYVFDGDWDVMRQRRFSPAELEVELHKLVRSGPVPLRLLFEERLGGSGRLPEDYKIFAFGGHLAGIDVVRRTELGQFTYQSFTCDWRPWGPTHTTCTAELDLPKPKQLDALLSVAKTLGQAYGSFIRLDFYLLPRGPVFGEFTSLPANGEGFTEATDKLFAELWERECPGMI